MPKLNIVTVCYNDPDFEKTAQSIVNQTFQDFYWVVVDGNSKPDIIQTIKKYEYRIDKFISEPDKGLYDAYNKGISYVNEGYIHFLNSGDKYSNNDVLKNIFENKDYKSDILYGDINFVKQNSEITNIKFKDELGKYFFINENIATPSTFVKYDLFKKFGNFSLEYKIVSDLERWIVFHKNNASFEHINITVADFDTTGISSKKENKKLHNCEKKELYKKYYSEKELEEAIKNHKIKLKFFEKIFSVKNLTNSEYKMVTILNFHIKIKKKDKKG